MSRTNTHPIRRGIAKTPVIMQLEALECGAASLAMILAYYGKWIPLEQVRKDCGVSRDGSNASNMMAAARSYGLTAQGHMYTVEKLRTKATFPCIVHWEFRHFVVVKGFKGGKVYLNDPGKGSLSMSVEAFDKSFSGTCITFDATEEFVPEGRAKSIFTFAGEYLKKAKHALIFTVMISLITSALQIFTPGFSRLFVDRILTNRSPDYVMPFFAFLAGFIIIQIIISLISDIYSLRISGKLAASGNVSYMWKILHMPIDFFSQRHAGDLQQRQAANAIVTKTLISTFAPLFFNIVMMILYLVIMIRYSWVLTLVGLLTIVLNGIVSNIVSKKRINITRVSAMDSANLAVSTLGGISMIETIKASGAATGYFQKWAGYQAGSNMAQVRFIKVSQYLGAIPSLLLELANSAVLVLGVYLCMQGYLTVGVLFAFQGMMSLFMNPAMTIITSGQRLQEMRVQMERIDDVMKYPEDDVFKGNVSTQDRKLSGRVEIKNLSFGYARLKEPVIKNFNMTLEPGKSVAIVGSSGCGKSTVSRLISGLYKHWEGEILFDGIPIGDLDERIFHASLGVVDQEVILFEDTIANNIRLWDRSIEDFEVILAARDARIYDDIMDRPHAFQYVVKEGGKDFSGGQRQRLEIARVLAADPTIIVLDEATSALDAKTEYEVVSAIRDRGISCIVVAHRLSTIRSCDEIIVLSEGEIADRGSHEELFERCEIYRELVTAS